MRKILIIVLIIALLAGFCLMIISGISFVGFEIPSIQKIVNDNRDLDMKIADLDNTIKSDYVSAQTALEGSITKLQESKQKYQDTINYSTEDEIKAARQTEKYEIGFIWTKIGMYATKNDIVMKADVSAGTLEGLYNITFTAFGEYISISDFIHAIENDSKLGFRIEDFNLVPDGENTLKASFTVKNVSIDKDSLTESGVATTTNDDSVKNNDTQTTTNAE